MARHFTAQVIARIGGASSALAWACTAACAAWLAAGAWEARAQDPAAPADAAAPTDAAAPVDAAERLDQVEARLAERYDRLELLAGRLAELSGSAQPRRAELLREFIARGRQQNVPGQFEEVVAALADESYSTAVDSQAKLQADLEKLLELLLQEDRDRQLESERKRVLRYLQDLNKLIRLQRGVRARTDGGDDAEALASDQQRVGDEAAKLQREIEDAEAPSAEQKPPESADSEEAPDNQAEAPQNRRPSGEQGEPSQGDGAQKPADQSEGDPPPRDPAGEAPEQENREEAPKPQSDDQENKAPSEQPGGPQPSGEPQQGNQQSPGPQSPGEQQSPQQQSGEGQSPPPSESGEPQSQPSSPMQRASEGLQRAQRQMQQAKRQLDQARRQGALADQQKAIEQLEQAKAELERILRQLREEELERMLVLLEARFRKMLDEQNEVYEETQKLDASASNVPEHELEIASGRLSRREGLIVREADRALVLLREDGTSVAFPEAIEQAREDMQQIAERLNRAKVDMITQGMEEDVIASLEQALKMLQQSLQDLRDQKAQQSSGGGGQPGEQPLVDQLAELRMIRELQVRVNRRTEQYGALVGGEQALEAELLGLLDELALRQAKIVEATRDLETGSNQ